MVNNYFVRNINGSRTLYKVVNSGSRYYETSRHIVKPMIWLDNEWKVNEKASPIILVYGKLKGFSARVTDKDIMSVIDPSLSLSEQQRDFDEMRKYFNEPTSSEVETWHRSGETILTTSLWTPFAAIPKEWF